MRKVKNSPSNYFKRSQMRPACVVVERVAEEPRKRTADDFSRALIDNNFYVSFRLESKVDKRK